MSNRQTKEANKHTVSPTYLDKFCSFLLCCATDLANHDDALCLRIRHKLLKAVHEISPVERVAADANAC